MPGMQTQSIASPGIDKQIKQSTICCLASHLVLATFILTYAETSTEETNHASIIVDDELAVREEILSQ